MTCDSSGFGPSRRLLRRGSFPLTAALVLAAVFAAPAPASIGGLAQKSGVDGCISEDGSGGACADGRALQQPVSVAISPDGKNAYVASGAGPQSALIGIFDRDPATGKLTQKTGTDGCIGWDYYASDSNCSGARGLHSVDSLVVSPDGKNVYGVSDVALVIFDRDPTTGKLNQKPGNDGCIWSGFPSPTQDCAVGGRAFRGAQQITVSPDGKNIYFASGFLDLFGGWDGSVAIFDRNSTTGALTQKTGTDGCISETGFGGACTDGVALAGAFSITVSPDGKSAYVATFNFSSGGRNGVAIFDRDPTTGKLTQKAGTDACMTADGSGGTCQVWAGLSYSLSVTVSPDGMNAYATGEPAVTIFDRDPATGKLTKKAGTDGCISATGTGGNCATGAGIDNSGSVTISPDGSFAYVVSGNGVAIFDRDPTTGKLTQKAGIDGCISENGTGGVCADGGASLNQATRGIVSPDGKNFYTLASYTGAISVLDVDPDGVAPDTTIDSGPTGTTNNSSPSFTLSADDPNATFECKLDSEPWSACSSPQSYSNLPDGPHTFSVRASDQFNNTDPSPATREFNVDTAAPDTTIDSGPTGTTNNSSPSFTLSADDPNATFECKLDSGPWSACNSPQSYSNLPDGPHTFSVRASDQFKHTDPSPATREFTIDTALDGKATASKTQKQKGKKIVVKVKVKAKEDLDATASGKVTVKKKSYKLKKADKSVAKGKSATLKLKPAKSKDAKKIAESLKKSKGKAKVDVTLADGAGNSKKFKLAVTLKG